MRKFFIVMCIIVSVFLSFSIPQYVFAISNEGNVSNDKAHAVDPLAKEAYGMDVLTSPAEDSLLPNNYQKDRIIIRFKQGTGLSAVATDLINKKVKFETITGDSTLDDVNALYGVTAIKPLITSKLFNPKKKKNNTFSSDSARALEKQKNAYIAANIADINSRYPSRAQHSNSAQQIALATKLANTFILTFNEDKDNPAEIKEAYLQDPSVESVELIGTVYATYEPTDPYYSSSDSWGQNFPDMYGMHPDFLHCGDPLVNEGAWAQSKGEGIVVAVIDSGVDYNHPDLEENMWQDAEGHYGYDFANDDSDPIDDHGHGTHCAGTIAAVENGIGVIGVAPLAKIMAVKGLKASGIGYDDVLANAIIYAVENGADVLSNSWGRSGNSNLLNDAFDFAQASGCVSVAAAGNSARDAAYFTPAGIQSVVTVAASDSNHARASFSNYGTKIDVSAPGVGVLSLRAAGTDMYGNGTHIINNDYYYANGTSMACPHVAGVVALVRAANSNFTNEEVRSVLRASATDLGDTGFDIQFGSGLVNADAALDISSPLVSRIISNKQISNQTIEVRGLAYGNSFNSYTLEYAESLEGTWITADNIVPGEKQSTIDPEGNVIYPVLGTFDVEGLDTIVYARLTVYNQNNEPYYDFIQSLIIQEQKPGWPVNAFSDEQGIPAYPVIGSPMVANIDNSADGTKEVVVNAIAGIFVFDVNGNVMPGWPKSYLWPHGSGGYSTPAIADLDGDGDMEIITMGYGYTYASTSLTIPGTDEPIAGLHIWHHDGTRYNDQWPQTLENYLPNVNRMTHLGYSSPSAGDIDMDGAQEIVVAVRYGTDYSGKTRCALLAFEQDGSLVVDSQNSTQWPRLLDVNGVFMGKLLESTQTPLLVDLNNDGMLEIVQAVSFTDDSVTPQEPSSEIKVYDAYGNIPENTQWPWTSDVASLGKRNLVAGDINGDGEIEIIAKTSISGVCSTKIFSGTGEEIATISDVALLSVNFSLADMNDDGKPEIIYLSMNKNLNVSSLEGDQLVPLPGWPQKYQNNLMYGNSIPSAGPSVADVNGDGSPDIIVAANAGGDTPYASLKAFDKYGNLLSGWPKYVQPFDLIYAQPTITDMDNDGLVDMVIGNFFGQVLAYGLEYDFSTEAQQWPMFQRNLQHSGMYGEEPIIENYLPTAHAGEDISTDEETEVALIGSGFDPDGFIINYQWEQVDGPEITIINPNEAETSFIAPSVDEITTLTFKLTVTDDDNATGCDYVVITVNPVIAPNVPPIANAGDDQTQIVAYPYNPTSVTLDGTNSNDPDGSIVSYEWSENGNVIGTDAEIDIMFNVNIHTITLTVTDNDGEESSDEVIVTIAEEDNVAPSANAGEDISTDEETEVALIGSGFDPDGFIINYQWEQVDGPEITIMNPNEAETSFIAPSVDEITTLTFKLTVTDDDNATGCDYVVITVNPVIAPNVPPIANAGDDQIVYAWYPVVLDATQSHDPDEGPQPLAYAWEQIDANADIVFISEEEGIVSFEAPSVKQSTTFSFRVIVSDGIASNEDTVQIIVQPNTLPEKIENSKIFSILGGNSFTYNLTENINDLETTPLLQYSWKQFAGIPVTEGGMQYGKTMFFTAPFVKTKQRCIFRIFVHDGSKSIFYDVAVEIMSHNETPE